MTRRTRSCRSGSDEATSRSAASVRSRRSRAYPVSLTRRWREQRCAKRTSTGCKCRGHDIVGQVRQLAGIAIVIKRRGQFVPDGAQQRHATDSDAAADHDTARNAGHCPHMAQLADPMGDRFPDRMIITQFPAIHPSARGERGARYQPLDTWTVEAAIARPIIARQTRRTKMTEFGMSHTGHRSAARNQPDADGLLSRRVDQPTPFALKCASILAHPSFASASL